MHFNNGIASAGSKAHGGLLLHLLDQLIVWALYQMANPLSPPTDVSAGSPSPGGFLGASLQPVSSGSPGGAAQPSGKDDIIPATITIKNIPLSIKHETLLEIIVSLSIPTPPYTFNSWGLAFANFHILQTLIL